MPEDSYIKVPMSKEDLDFCTHHAKLMCNGFKTYSFKHGTVQSEDVYVIGKIGELACKRYFESLPNTTIIHEPFRDSYARFHPDDDFILQKNGVKTHIEVRTKQRNVNPRDDYECCTDVIKPNMVYLFVSYNKITQTAYLLGYANWRNFSSSAFETVKGTSNNNFVHKTTEFNIKIKDLNQLLQI